MMLTLFLIAINVLVTLIYMQKEEPRDFLFFPYLVAKGQGIRGLIYSQFSHSGWSHLIFNMITLFFFGRSLEETAPGVFLLTYFFAAVGADLATILIHSKNPNYASLGASGSVAGVLFCSIVFYPANGIIIFPLPIPIPAPIFAILYIAGSIYMARTEARNVNHEAHIGGALVGFVIGALSAPGGLSGIIDYFRNLI